MKVLKKIVAIAAVIFLFAMIVQSASLNQEESHIVKRGIFDCPHDCWGDICKCGIVSNW